MCVDTCSLNLLMMFVIYRRLVSPATFHLARCLDLGWNRIMARLRNVCCESYPPVSSNMVGRHRKSVNEMEVFPAVAMVASRVNPIKTSLITGWWFGTSILFSHDYWECHHPNWRTPSFFRTGWLKNHQPVMSSDVLNDPVGRLGWEMNCPWSRAAWLTWKQTTQTLLEST